MKANLEDDPALVLVDAVLRDLATRSGMYVGRRDQEGGDATFVMQTGEEGRTRLRVPDISDDASIEALVASAQTYLTAALGQPLPMCPIHDHALKGLASSGELWWSCPVGEWECRLGDYEEATWPQFDVQSLAPVLSRRLRRRGEFPAVRTIAVSGSGARRVAQFGLVRPDPELLKMLAEVADPLPVETHEEPDVTLRPL